MRFLPGFIAGAAVGGFVVSKLTPEQRRGAAQFASDAASKVRSTQVGEAVSNGVAHVADAAGERVSAVVSAGTEAVAGAVAPDQSDADRPADGQGAPPRTAQGEPVAGPSATTKSA